MSFCAFVDKSAFTDDQRFLAAHNYFRCRHNMPQLKHDDHVKARADEFKTKLEETCKMEHSDKIEGGFVFSGSSEPGFSNIKPKRNHVTCCIFMQI